MGQLSDGRTCYGSPGSAVSFSTDTCPSPLQDLIRKSWIPSTPYEADWFRRVAGYTKCHKFVKKNRIDNKVFRKFKLILIFYNIQHFS
jgi:hypothetical protein